MCADTSHNYLERFGTPFQASVTGLNTPKVHQMSRNILITGGSGYIGGSLLAELKSNTSIPAHGTVYALVRSDDQAQKARSVYNATPLMLDLNDQSAITEALVEKEISVVFFMINAFTAVAQLKLIDALATVKQKLSMETHFLHTTGAKLFSNFTGHPTDKALSDADDDLYDIQKNAKSRFAPMETVRLPAMNAEVLLAAMTNLLL